MGTLLDMKGEGNAYQTHLIDHRFLTVTVAVTVTVAGKIAMANQKHNLSVVMIPLFLLAFLAEYPRCHV